MAEIILFRSKAEIDDEEPDIDLLTAIDTAIRDLRDISERWGEEASRKQAEECLRMLERVYIAAI